MIRCDNVHKRYQLGDQSVHALRGVDLYIEQTGFYAIMGQSGSGKSTLLHLLGALEQPDQGRIEIAGRPIHDLLEADATIFRRKSVGIIFQQYNLLSTLTARENVELPGVLAGHAQTELSARSTLLLDRLGLADRADHRPDALSGGEQQRVAIARALFFEPPVVLADEPTGNLDSDSSNKLWAVLSEIAREQDVTVVMVTHEPAAAAHCAHTYVLRDGAVVGSFDTENLDAGSVATRYQQLVG